MAGKSFRIVFEVPDDRCTYYYFRMIGGVYRGRTTNKPQTTADVREAHKFFNSEACVAHRDQFRKDHPLCRIYIQDHEGNGPLFERDIQPPSEPEDHRPSYFVSPDIYESAGLGFVVKPAIRPTGRCWCITAASVPSVADRDFETIYAETPLACVERMMQIWGTLAQPYEHPDKDARDDAELRSAIKQLENVKYGAGRLRPGDRAR